MVSGGSKGNTRNQWVNQVKSIEKENFSKRENGVTDVINSCLVKKNFQENLSYNKNEKLSNKF